MNSNKRINAPEGAKYLSVFMDELPVNCIFNKGITGCGGTELALIDNNNTMIVMPFVSLVINKVEKKEHYGKVLGVYDKVTEEDIRIYIGSHNKWKIVLTYDALPRVINILKNMNIDAYSRFNLLVDEYHLLFNQYCFRNKSIKPLLNHSKKFNKVTYMTATPLEEEYMLTEIKELPIVELIWPNRKQVTINRQPCGSCSKYVNSLIKDKLEDKIFGNLHFFVNSVKFIKKCIDKNALNPLEVKIVCANSRENQLKLKGYSISKPADPSCKLNFYTSTSFEGCDIYDEEGKIYIVSDGYKKNTLYDISTLFIQIIGRIRNSNYNDEVEHICSKCIYNGSVTYEEYKTIMEEEFYFYKDLADKYNKKSDIKRKILIKQYGEEYFRQQFIHITDESKFETDKNLLNRCLQDYKLQTLIYNKDSYLISEYNKNNFKCINKKYYYSDKLKAKNNSKTTFKGIIEEWHKIISEHSIKSLVNKDERCVLLKLKNNQIEDYYNTLGIEKIRSLGYNLTKIKREFTKKSDKPHKKKIQELIVAEIGKRKLVKQRYIKQKLQEIYNLLGMNKTAKASDVKKYFLTIEKVIKEEGKSIKCIELVKEKLLAS